MPEETVISYVPSPQFRTCLIDGAVAVTLSDHISDRVAVSFTRFEAIPLREPAQWTEDNRIRSTSGYRGPEMKQQRTVEFSIEIRPDTALSIINNLLTTLAQLPEGRKKLYGIPANIAPIPAVPLQAR
jgi:hypothetical protein